MRILQLSLACFLLLLTAFCCFGFLASFEPMPHALAWKLGYACLGVASLGASGLLALNAFRCSAVNAGGTGHTKR